VGDGHELIHGWPANDGIEGEVDLHDVEEDALRAVVLRHPECDRERDATERDDGAWARTKKRVRRGEPGHENLQLLESCNTDKVKGYSAIN
jgi:hypothetical protein